MTTATTTTAALFSHSVTTMSKQKHKKITKKAKTKTNVLFSPSTAKTAINPACAGLSEPGLSCCNDIQANLGGLFVFHLLDKSRNCSLFFISVEAIGKPCDSNSTCGTLICSQTFGSCLCSQYGIFIFSHWKHFN